MEQIVDRRAFLRDTFLTAAGLWVPGRKVFSFPSGPIGLRPPALLAAGQMIEWSCWELRLNGRYIAELRNIVGLCDVVPVFSVAESGLHTLAGPRPAPGATA